MSALLCWPNLETLMTRRLCPYDRLPTRNGPLRLLQLPPEILDRIFEEVAAWPYAERAPLCLVCKDLLALARHVLYHNVDIGQAADEDSRRGDANQHICTEKSVLLLRTLASPTFPPQRFGTIRLDVSQPHLAPSFGLATPFDWELVDQLRSSQIELLDCTVPGIWVHGATCMQFLSRAPKALMTIFKVQGSNTDGTRPRLLGIRRKLSGCITMLEVQIGGAGAAPGTVSIIGSPLVLTKVLAALRSNIDHLMLHAGRFAERLATPDDILKLVRDMPAIDMFSIMLHPHWPATVLVDEILSNVEDSLRDTAVRAVAITCLTVCGPSVLIDLVRGLKLASIKHLMIIWESSVIDELGHRQEAEEVRAFCAGSTPAFADFRDSLAASGTILDACIH